MLEYLTQSLAQSSLADRIGWVLVHSLWQFALVAFVALVLQRALKRCSATARYWALLAAMSIMVAVPVATWFSPWSVDASSAVGDGLRAVPQSVGWASPTKKSVMGSQGATGSASAVSPNDIQHSFESLPSTGGASGTPSEPQAELQHLTPALTGIAALLSRLQSRVQPWLPEIVLVWFAGVVLAALRPLFSWYTVRRLRTVGVSPVGDMVQKVLERTAKRLRLARAVEVLQSTLVKTPVVVGHFRPVVLLPLCVVTGLPEPQLELILAHELAHIRRHDYLINLLQTLVETLFFYHPAVWWLSRQIRNERENCCDDLAMATVGTRADYGRALLAIEELRATSPALSLAAHGGSLLARIRRIAGCEPAPRIAGGGSIFCLLLLTIAIFAAVAWAASPATKKLEETLEETTKTSPGPNDTPWGDPLMGLRTRLSANAIEYRQGRSLTLRMELQNASDKPVAFSTMTRSNVLIAAEDATGRWLGDPRSAIGIGPWEGRQGALDPGAIIRWEIPLASLRFIRQVAAGREATLRASGPVQQEVPGKLPINLSSNKIRLTFKDTFPPAMSAAELPDKWSKSMTFAYRYEPGIFDPEGRGVNGLEVDGDGRAYLVMRYGDPHKWSREKGDPHEARKRLLPEGRTEAKLSQERLDQLAKVLHDHEAWNVRQFEAVSNSDEPEIRVCVISGPTAMIGNFPMRVIRQQPAIAAIQREAESLMADVVAAARATSTDAATEANDKPPALLTAFGKVLDPNGKPVAGATVHLREWSTYRISSEPYNRTSNDILATTRTDAQGAFRFDKVPVKPLSDQWLKQIPWDVVVVARPYAIAWRHFDAAQQSKPFTINLTPEAKISGRVTDQQGRPVQNAEVRISGIQPLGSDAHCSAYADPDVLDLQQSRLMDVARTDTDGQTTIEGLPSDLLVQLSIHHDAFRSDSTFVATTDQPQPDMEIPNYENGKPKEAKKIKVECKRFAIAMKPPLPKLIGRILAADTKKPLPGARITGWGVPDTVTDQDGQFVVREVRQPQCHAIINSPEGSGYLGRLVFIDVPQDKKETHVDIELPRGEVVSGIIVDDAGQGVAGVVVGFDSGMGLAISADTPERTMASYQKTGRDGRFRIAVPPGKGKLVISGPVPGYNVPRWSEDDAGDEFSREINVTAGQTTPEVKFIVQRMANAPEEKLVARRGDWLTKARRTIRITVEGKVVDPEGKPAAGAEVGLDQWFRNSDGEFHPVKTDQDGHFSFQVKPYGLSEEFIVATHKERKLRGHLRLSLKPQEETLKAPVTIQLVSTGIVKGSVVEGDKPISGVWIQFSEYVPTPGSSNGALTCTNRDFAISDEHGRFEFPLVEASKKFGLHIIAVGGYTDAQCSGQVETGKTLEVKPFSLTRLDKSVAGTVVDPDGNPVAGVSVSAEMRSGEQIPRAFTRQPTGTDGRFVIRGVPNVPLTLMAYIRPSDDAKDRTIRFSARVDADPGQTDVRIVLDPKLVRGRK